jgi:ankyrin repeat protein
MKAALKTGADPNTLSNTRRRMSPLSCVLLHDTNKEKPEVHEAAEALFAAGAKLGFADHDILFGPISNGSVEMVRLLMDKGASPTDKMEGRTPAEWAKYYDQPTVYDYLVSRGGIPVNALESAQISLVHGANYHDLGEMERAVKDGARINGTSPDGMSPLLAALYYPTSRRSEAETIWWLLDHGADPNQQASTGEGKNLPLHLFVATSQYTIKGASNEPEAGPSAEETLTRLLKAGAKISGMDSLGRTPLHIAAKFDNVRAAEMLIAEGAKIMPRDNAGKTPLDYAESGTMIKMLKANGAKESER